MTEAAGGSASAHNAMIQVVESKKTPEEVKQTQPEAITNGEKKE